jgi:hypothetical protein
MPRFPFNYIYMPPGPPDLRWDRIEGVSGMHFSELQHTALADSMSRYLVALAGESATAKTPDVKCHLESIVKHTRTLINLWSPYRRKRPPDNKQMNLHHAVLGLFPSDFDRDRLICQLVKHRNDAQHTLTHLRQQGQRGRPQQ